MLQLVGAKKITIKGKAGVKKLAVMRAQKVWQELGNRLPIKIQQLAEVELEGVVDANADDEGAKDVVIEIVPFLSIADIRAAEDGGDPKKAKGYVQLYDIWERTRNEYLEMVQRGFVILGPSGHLDLRKIQQQIVLKPAKYAPENVDEKIPDYVGKLLSDDVGLTGMLRTGGKNDEEKAANAQRIRDTGTP
eukprot:gnl/MRDRNA2_/MRDRNA2_154851_c0_seq1.p2 gnl/MRDRNA2_/MRDRNA2_154851_c0~~gnl/MRDRNA2_/MRDRNA2_154851_c0_seq1.p2  ORF type:complete len:191 (-),score=57.67 gnl/MRDRNA2_/MRDRNA2_154851_c0_seq1:352-924(-)